MITSPTPPPAPIAIEVVIPAPLFRSLQAAVDADVTLTTDTVITTALAAYLFERCFQKPGR